MGSEKEFFEEKFMANVVNKLGDVTCLLDYDDLEILEGDVKVSTDGPYPKIFFSEHVHEILDKSMEQIVVIRFLGRTIGYKALINRIQSLWKPIWDFQIRLSGLPYKFYNKKLLRFIVGTLVKVVKMDYNTTTRKIGKFARFAIVIELLWPWMLASGWKCRPIKLAVVTNNRRNLAIDKETPKNTQFDILNELEEPNFKRSSGYTIEMIATVDRVNNLICGGHGPNKINDSLDERTCGLSGTSSVGMGCKIPVSFNKPTSFQNSCHKVIVFEEKVGHKENTHKPDILVLMKTRVSGRKADDIIQRTSFDFLYRVEMKGFSRAYNCSFFGHIGRKKKVLMARLKGIEDKLI
ncbi:hypothetical protein Goklo_014371, partial [Gossypium klotzschianum]|nr:hypothetical protein [Gossypium klotzschianum]